MQNDKLAANDDAIVELASPAHNACARPIAHAMA
jgi:hypothetical protein